MTASRKAIWQRALVFLTFILVAQLLLAPAVDASGGCPFCYRVRCGDTLSSIARRFGVTVRAIASANRIVNPNRIFTGQCLLIPCPTVHAPVKCVYVVQPCDTLSIIARRFGTSVRALQCLNNIHNPNRIFVGQRLRIC
jgi:putative chitinase